MPLHRSPLKRIRADAKRRLRKKDIISRLKTLEKRFKKLADENKVTEAAALLENLRASLNKASSKSLIHKNKASRKISRLMTFFNKKAKKA